MHETGQYIWVKERNCGFKQKPELTANWQIEAKLDESAQTEPIVEKTVETVACDVTPWLEEQNLQVNGQ